MRTNKSFCLAAVLVGVATASQPAGAQPNVPFTIDMSVNDNGLVANITTDTSALKEFPVAGVPGAFEYTATGISLGNTGAIIDQLTLGMVGDPSVTLNFTLTAGAVPVVFTLNSAIVPVGLVNPIGNASAGLTLTDRNGNGASLTGGYGGDAYRATYNTGVPNVFTTLDPSFAAGAFLTASESGAVLPTVIPGAVADMQASFKFTLSANDSASGTSFYQILPRSTRTVPESGSGLAMLSLSVLSLFAVNRKNLERLISIFCA